MRVIKTRNPRTGIADYEFEAADGTEIHETARALREAQKTWAAKSLEARGEILLEFAEVLKANREAVSDALETDTGRRRIAGLEVDGVIASIHAWTAQSASLLPSGWQEGRSMPHIKHAPQFVPYALVGVISPWNFPMTLSMIDTIPALLAGCSVIVKPSEVTPRFAEPLSRIIQETGLAEILKIMPGDGRTGAALVDESDAICFTGSVATGRKVYAAAAENMIPAFLELGGKDPLIVLESADIEAASTAALRGSVLSTGQACQSIERIYVARPVFDDFLARLTSKAQAVRLNYPDINRGEIGPVIFEKQAEILQKQIDDARSKGAKVHSGGQVENLGGGLYLKPTVLSDITAGMLVMQEETFGPMLPVMPFETPEEAINLANDSEYGLSAAVFAGSLDEAESIARQLDTGAVSLNDAALTGLFHEAEKNSFKLSGLGGSRMGPAGFQRFCRRKALIANTQAPAPLSAFAEDA